MWLAHNVYQPRWRGLKPKQILHLIQIKGPGEYKVWKKLKTEINLAPNLKTKTIPNLALILELQLEGSELLPYGPNLGTLPFHCCPR